MKNMRLFFEAWAPNANRQLTTDEIKNDNRSLANCQLATDDLMATIEDSTIPSIRQSPTGGNSESDLAAFFSIGFTQHMEIIFKCKSQAERWYYIRKAAMEFWSVEEVKRHIRAKDYQVNG